MQAMEVSAPATRVAWPITWHDWDELIKRIGRCKSELDRMAIGASVFFSGAVSFLAVALVTTSESSIVRTVFWSVFVGSVLLGVLCLLSRRETVRTQSDKIADVLGWMKQLESPYLRPSETNLEDTLRLQAAIRAGLTVGQTEQLSRATVQEKKTD